MCTTFLLTEMIGEFSDLDVIGYPRLVRLNPNVPWKTRGNAALSVEMGIGRGERKRVGCLGGETVYSYDSGKRVEPTKEMLSRAEKVLDKWYVRGEKGTNPGLALLRNRPPASLYWQAVRGIVEKGAVEKMLAGELKATRGNGRGLIGASASIAWRPRDRTYEVIAYRDKAKWGTERAVEAASVVSMDRKFPSTFNNYDPRHNKVAIAPGSPCPILFGIRGDDPGVLEDAMRTIKGERPERWLIYIGNQGTDDHLAPPKGRLAPFTSVKARATVVSEPRTIVGSHAFVDVRIGKETIAAAAYEPSKEFRAVVRALLPGDKVIVCGGVRDEPRTLNLEKIRIVRLMSAQRKVANPLCAKCGKRMKSVGKGQGYKCIRCGAKSKNPEMAALERMIKVGWYEPPISARRHLAKPLKRMGA
jgi:tRNA(Ile2)-agmatinylcytidine synthase